MNAVRILGLTGPGERIILGLSTYKVIYIAHAIDAQMLAGLRCALCPRAAPIDPSLLVAEASGECVGFRSALGAATAVRDCLAVGWCGKRVTMPEGWYLLCPDCVRVAGEAVDTLAMSQYRVDVGWYAKPDPPLHVDLGPLDDE